ncbi:MAG: 2Fe-2S ferredoxin [Rhodospirillaceae bacterium TMED167]|nr:2Fe-2S ferredoxin [Rhodospirillaceae bacterium]OUW23516.1 MAG: 2Fe-2S ferredoxin [Rhodospirillaceae bacterium TMED167]
MPKVIFELPGGERREIDAEPGKSLLVTAHQNGIDIEGACEGVMACSTCHLIVAEDWYERLPDASEEEDDMLDLAYGLTKTSRLGCQITVTEDLDGLVIKVPDETRNMMM